MARFKDFFRVTLAQQRGIGVLTVLLLLAVAAVAIRDCRGGKVPVEISVIQPDSLAVHRADLPEQKDSVFYFDPSVADSSTFVRLGFSPAQARTIIRYRNSVGGRFRSLQQFARCYAVSDSMFRRLEPYIRMGVPVDPPKPNDFSTVDVNRASLSRLKAHSALTDALAEKVFRARIRYGGFVDAEQLCAAIPSDSTAVRAFSQYAVFDPAAIVRYEVNGDSERLLAEHPYISRLFAREIVRCRDRCGRIECYDSLRPLKYFPRGKDHYLEFYLTFDIPKTDD